MTGHSPGVPYLQSPYMNTLIGQKAEADRQTDRQANKLACIMHTQYAYI